MTAIAEAPVARTVVTPVAKRLPISLSVATVLLLALFLLAPRHGTAVFRLDDGTTALKIPDQSVSADLVVVLVSILLVLLSAWSWTAAVRRIRAGAWVPIVFAILGVFAFVTWAAADANGRVPVVNMLYGAISLAVPLAFGALGGVVGERAGVVNVAIEGQLLLGAFLGAVFGTLAHNPLFGLVGAIIGGMLVAFVLAAFAIKYLVEQVIVGVVLNVLVSGLTTFLFTILLVPNSDTLNTTPQFGKIKIPLLSEIPVLGPVLFNQNLIVYLLYIAVPVVAFGLYRTRWGLRLRAVGEYPRAADTVGIKVNATRFWNLMLAGALAGIGGAYFTLVSVPHFNRDMTNGAGFIALAAVIFGRWDPVRATLAALLFGFATNLQNTFGAIGTPVPGEFLLMLPYVVTLIAVVGFVGQIKAPAADGKPYIKS